MAINVFDSFLKEFEQPITAFVSTSVSNLASYIDGPLRTAVMLYVILYGFAVMRGAISEPIMEFAWRAMRIVVVVLLATNSSTFQQYVTGLFFNSLPKEIGNALAGSGLNTSSGAPFDQLLSKGIDVANKIYDQAGMTDVAPALDCGHSSGLCGRRIVPAIRHSALRQSGSWRRHCARPGIHCAGSI